MTHQAEPSSSQPDSDPGRKIAQLQETFLLVAALAERPDLEARRDTALDAAARISAAYEAAPPVAQRRFDALAAETAAWAGSGLDALLAIKTARPAAAAARLADELDRSLADLGGLVGA